MSEQSTGKRVAYIDFLKAFAIATVLLGHSVEQLSGDAFWDHPIWTFLYSFHMPLFMFVSGLFSSRRCGRASERSCVGRLSSWAFPR